MKMYQDIKRCPLCGGITKKKGSVYLEFICQEMGCGAAVRFPSELKIDADEQIRRFNNRVYEPDMIQLNDPITGEWIDFVSPWFSIPLLQCSVCKKTVEWVDHLIKPNFCPWCGIKTEGGETNETDN